MVDTAGHPRIGELLFYFFRDSCPDRVLSTERPFFICHDFFCLQSDNPHQRYPPGRLYNPYGEIIQEFKRYGEMITKARQEISNSLVV